MDACPGRARRAGPAPALTRSRAARAARPRAPHGHRARGKSTDPSLTHRICRNEFLVNPTKTQSGSDFAA
ncbi:hypothetical protein FMEAI12_5540044 [Parafrankia sp. Ea1.12]|nr:hypothetical protein FMEAI12_5540044 [Parafrankia sp. Ea1.12]